MFWIILPHPATLIFFYFLAQNYTISKVKSSNQTFSQYIFRVACNNTNISKTHLSEAEQITKLDFYFHPQTTKNFVLTALITTRNDSLNFKLTPNLETLSVLVEI